MLHRPLTPILWIALAWCIFPALGHESPSVEVLGHYDHAIGTSEAASQGVIGARLLGSQALLRPAQVLENIPGMVVTQHSGEGKANQYFLRGINLDHGTDFATTVNGVPVNLPTHAHGQGYSDLNFLMPELLSRVDYQKGPYFAADGDFSSVGSARLSYRTRLDKPVASVTLGQRGHRRFWTAGSHELGDGRTLLVALEGLQNNGPWAVPQGMHKSNAQLILSGGSAREGWSASLSSYAARWQSTDQIPQRLIDAGTYRSQPFGRFDSLDPSDGASTTRTSLSGSWQQRSDSDMTRLQAYALAYRLDLFSNFTYSLERTSDQFVQTDRRTVLGGQAAHTWWTALDTDQPVQNTVGVQLRHDRIRAGLFDSVARRIQATVRDDSAQQTQIGVYAENEIGWNAWLRSVAGLRADRFDAQVSSHTQAANSGSTSAYKVSPKLSLVFGPWAKTEFFVNAGRGFHSNDARGATLRVDPRTGEAVQAVPALAGSRGRELGLKSEIVPQLQTTLAIWQLDFDSELVYAGDAGTTEAGRASRRTGIEWSNHWSAGEHLRLDANLAWTRPRFVGGDPLARHVPNAVQRVAHLGLAWRRLGPWSASLTWRYIGAAPLTEDNTARSAASQTMNLKLERQVDRDLDLTLDVLNLGNRSYNDIAYFYTSRVAGEAAGVSGLHVHPAEPRSLRLTARLRF